MNSFPLKFMNSSRSINFFHFWPTFNTGIWSFQVSKILSNEWLYSNSVIKVIIQDPVFFFVRFGITFICTFDYLIFRDLWVSVNVSKSKRKCTLCIACWWWWGRWRALRFLVTFGNSIACRGISNSACRGIVWRVWRGKRDNIIIYIIIYVVHSFIFETLNCSFDGMSTLDSWDCLSDPESESTSSSFQALTTDRLSPSSFLDFLTGASDTTTKEPSSVLMNYKIIWIQLQAENIQYLSKIPDVSTNSRQGLGVFSYALKLSLASANSTSPSAISFDSCNSLIFSFLTSKAKE